MRNVVLFTLAAAISFGALANAASVSSLEAAHIFEIYTGLPVGSVELDPNKGKVYEVRSEDGQASARVDAIHGRLLSLQHDGGVGRYDWPGIRVVAHRGGVSLGPPENTLPAIAKAIEVGADLIEVDVRETADGHLVLMHDETVDRTCHGSGRVDELTLDAIRALEVRHDAATRIGVPTLAEALSLMKGRIDADLDYKRGDIGKLLVEVRAAGMEDHVTMHAAWERCASIATLEPRIRIRPTVTHAGQVRDLAKQLRPAMINFDWHSVTEASVRDAHLAGCLAFVNCLGSADTDYYVREAIRIGADYIQSDRPDRVMQILRERGARSDAPILGSALGSPLRHPRLRYPLR